MPDSFSRNIYESIVEPATLRKRRLSTLVDGADACQPPSKHPGRSHRAKRRRSEDNDATDCHTPKRRHISIVSDWLDSIPLPTFSAPPRERHSSVIGSRPIVAVTRRSRSAPAMPRGSSHAGPTPPSSRASKSNKVRSTTSTSSATSSKATSLASQVNTPLYRQFNLGTNGVILRPPTEPLPEAFNPILERLRAKRDSPEPDLKQWDEAIIALEMGTGESDVEECLKGIFFPKKQGPIFRSDKKPMFRDGLPHNPGSDHHICQPVPDIAHGYSRDAFTDSQWLLIANMAKGVVANNEGLVLPFHNGEFKADGQHGGGSLWVATNQCMGGAAICSRLAADMYERLSAQPDPAVRQYRSATFSTASTGSEGRLYITWCENETTIYIQRIENYLVQRHEEKLLFRRHMLNMIDWAKTERLEAIQHLLDEKATAERIERSVKSKSRSSLTRSESRSKRGRSSEQAIGASSLWQWDENKQRHYYDVNGVRVWRPS